MPFDDTSARHVHPPQARQVAGWLFGMCFMIGVMIVLGGTTRLTGSGLSIMEWAPLEGVLPPMSHAEWERLFKLYQQIPQYRLEHEGFGLAGFQHIFWLEWTHRLWGRLMGVAFLLPLIWFAGRGAIGKRLLPRLLLIFALGGLQGAVGWFMVASGFFPESTAVDATRLVIHLGLALVLYGTILWTALGLWQPLPPPAPRLPHRLTLVATVLVACTILAGGFVAGTHAGLTYNTFPLMDGHIVPPGYADQAFPAAFFHNIPTVQFDHRALATASLIVCLLAAALAARVPRAGGRAALLAGAVALQYALGIATLLFVVPIPLAACHQAVAVLVLTACLAQLHALRAAPDTSFL